MAIACARLSELSHMGQLRAVQILCCLFQGGETGYKGEDKQTGVPAVSAVCSLRELHSVSRCSGLRLLVWCPEYECAWQERLFEQLSHLLSSALLNSGREWSTTLRLAFPLVLCVKQAWRAVPRLRCQC